MSTLIVFAMEEESRDIFTARDVLHTGIGKVNAAYALTQHLHRDLAAKPPALVVNMGTAGSRKHKAGTVVNCTSFVQRDMNVSVLGFEKWQTPFSKDPVMLRTGQRIENLPEGICGTGDSFDDGADSAHFDVVDMEAYALALICQREEIPFLCLKYISDGADSNASQDWNDALNKAAETLKRTLEEAGL